MSLCINLELPRSQRFLLSMEHDYHSLKHKMIQRSQNGTNSSQKLQSSLRFNATEFHESLESVLFLKLGRKGKGIE